MISKARKEQLLWLAAFSSLGYAIYDCVTSGNYYLLVVSYLIAFWHTFFGVHIGTHRLFSHKAFVTSRTKEIFLMIEAVLCGYYSPISFVAVHRLHHAAQDGPNDPHSPYQYPWWYIVFGLVIFNSEKRRKELPFKVPKDLLRDPVLRFTEQYYYRIWLGLIVVTYLLFGFDVLIYALLAPVGFHILAVNTYTNLWSHSNPFPGNYRNFDEPSKSLNNKLVNWISFGEGLHNNHHANPTLYDTAIKPDEFDPAGWVVKKFFAK